MNKDHSSEEDLEEIIGNEYRAGIQQKGQKRKNPIGEQEKEASNQNKKRKEIRDTTNKIQNMKARRKIERQTLSETSESETDREYSRKSKNPNTGNNKSTRQSTILGYVNEVRQNLMR